MQYTYVVHAIEACGLQILHIAATSIYSSFRYTRRHIAGIQIAGIQRAVYRYRQQYLQTSYSWSIDSSIQSAIQLVYRQQYRGLSQAPYQQYIYTAIYYIYCYIDSSIYIRAAWRHIAAIQTAVYIDILLVWRLVYLGAIYSSVYILPSTLQLYIPRRRSGIQQIQRYQALYLLAATHKQLCALVVYIFFLIFFL